MTSGAIHDASWLITDRMAGVSQGAFALGNLAVHVGDAPEAVATNRAALAGRLGVAAVVFTRAAHSGNVAYVDEVVPDVPGTDALITDQSGLAIAAQGADCAMVGLSTADGWIAAIHCGWQGLVRGVVPAALDALLAAGSGLVNARAHIGPTICPDCYPVDEQRAAAMADVLPVAVVAGAAGPAIDLRAGVVAQLREYAVEVSADPRCTAETEELFSYRRDGITGRQALVVMRRAA
ncbi:MAG TPA: polyphenol oxidase family protein [Actinomycetota bacterium]|nr:polyphenol oxidase family protein [Actinomycetota bacterium]